MAYTTYAAYTLTEESRALLLERFPPRYPAVRLNHITVAFDVGPDALPPEAGDITVIGYAHDRRGLEALVVKVNGRLSRPDGKYYHITLSYDDTAAAPLAYGLVRGERIPYASLLSNRLIEHYGFIGLSQPIKIQAVPEIRESRERVMPMAEVAP